MYSTETKYYTLFSCTEKTFRIRYKLALNIFDGTDFHIAEQTPFGGTWYSHKCKGPRLRYEAGICVLTGHIVLIIGGYPCGAYLDLHIFREGLSEFLEVGEKDLFMQRDIVGRLLL